MLGLSIGLRALIANELAMRVAGNNLANAGTRGYTRQDVLFSPTVGYDTAAGRGIGSGVEAREVRRLIDDLLQARIRSQAQVAGRLDVKSAWLRDVESVFGEPSENGIAASIGEFFGALSAVSARPEDLETRHALVGVATSLSESLNLTATRLDVLRLQAAGTLESRIGELHEISERIAALNVEIAALEGGGRAANALRDQRDVALEDLSRLVDSRAVAERDGSITVLVAGRTLVAHGRAGRLELGPGASGELEISIAGSTRPLSSPGGEIQALLEVATRTIPDARASLDRLASRLVSEVNRAHATGVPLGGAFTQLVSAPVGDPAAALEALGVEAGDLFVNVTNAATGASVRTRLSIDPATASLSDFAAALDGVANLDAEIDAAGRLRLRAAAGHTFDFGRSLDPNPDDAAGFGTSVPSLSGAYTGGANARWRFVAEGDGTIGVTPSLRVRVLDEAGSTVALLDVGQGYAAGTELEVADGVRVAFGAGSIAASALDEFSTDLLAEPDTAGVLGALSLNAFFTGSNAGDIAVAASVAASPALVAAGDGAGPTDNRNALRLAALSEDSLEALSFASFSQFYGSLVQGVGFEARRSDQLRESQTALMATLEERRDEQSGVSIDEEAANLIQFQRNYQAAARFIQIVNESIDELIALVR